MKKKYEKPVLATEQFDVEDVITASTLGTVSTNGTGDDASTRTWETSRMGIEW
jgi:hypothetical protein